MSATLLTCLRVVPGLLMVWAMSQCAPVAVPRTAISESGHAHPQQQRIYTATSASMHIEGARESCVRAEGSVIRIAGTQSGKPLPTPQG
jgi:hypothetical protein